MSFPWFIARRYLTARRRQAFISLISAVSILGVGVGVMALIIAPALLTGVHAAPTGPVGPCAGLPARGAVRRPRRRGGGPDGTGGHGRVPRRDRERGALPVQSDV